MDWWPGNASSLPLVLAVADGHGSAKSFRSDVGAQLAVKTAISCLQEFFSGEETEDLSLVNRSFEEQLPREIERRWKTAVEQHLAEHPLFVNEVSTVGEKQGASARQAVEANPILAYGTTLLAVALHDSFLACLQLGDGDILLVDAEGQVLRPIAEDSRLFANETTSLGGEASWRDFRAKFQTLAGHPPALVLLATDGYSNSFSTPEGFQAVGPDLLDLLKTEGIVHIREQLPIWLAEASRDGSGDDVTVGMLVRFPIEPVQPRSDGHDTDQPVNTPAPP